LDILEEVWHNVLAQPGPGYSPPARFSKSVRVCLIIATSIIFGLALLYINIFNFYWLNLLTRSTAAWLAIISLVLLLILFIMAHKVSLKMFYCCLTLILMSALVFAISSTFGELVTVDKKVSNGSTYYLVVHNIKGISSIVVYGTMEYGTSVDVIEVFKCDASTIICPSIKRFVYYPDKLLNYTKPITLLKNPGLSIGVNKVSITVDEKLIIDLDIIN